MSGLIEGDRATFGDDNAGARDAESSEQQSFRGRISQILEHELLTAYIMAVQFDVTIFPATLHAGGRSRSMCRTMSRPGH